MVYPSTFIGESTNGLMFSTTIKFVEMGLSILPTSHTNVILPVRKRSVFRPSPNYGKLYSRYLWYDYRVCLLYSVVSVLASQKRVEYKQPLI
jgi:hypothetical protein